MLFMNILTHPLILSKSRCKQRGIKPKRLKLAISFNFKTGLTQKTFLKRQKRYMWCSWTCLKHYNARLYVSPELIKRLAVINLWRFSATGSESRWLYSGLSHCCQPGLDQPFQGTDPGDRRPYPGMWFSRTRGQNNGNCPRSWIFSPIILIFWCQWFPSLVGFSPFINNNSDSFWSRI